MSDIERLFPCPKCGKEIDIDNDIYIPDKDWKPTYYDPDSGENQFKCFVNVV